MLKSNRKAPPLRIKHISTQYQKAVKQAVHGPAAHCVSTAGNGVNGVAAFQPSCQLSQDEILRGMHATHDVCVFRGFVFARAKSRL